MRSDTPGRTAPSADRPQSPARRRKPCAVDWCHGTIIGNAHTHSMLEIWNGELMRNFRLKHLNGQKNQIDACRDCAFIKNFLDASHLDDDAHELVKNFN